MSKPIRRGAAAPNETQKELVRRITAEVEARTLRRVRAYLDRGRPLASFPLVSLRAQWIARARGWCIGQHDNG